MNFSSLKDKYDRAGDTSLKRTFSIRHRARRLTSMPMK
jgi:hypothetical protein